MSPSGDGSVLVLHTVQAEVHEERVPDAPQPRRYHDMSSYGFNSSIHALTLRQAVITAPVFSQMGASAPQLYNKFTISKPIHIYS